MYKRHQPKIVKAMEADPHRSWYASDLSEEIGVSKGGIYPALAGLESSNIVVSFWVPINRSQRRRAYKLKSHATQEEIAGGVT